MWLAIELACRDVMMVVGRQEMKCVLGAVYIRIDAMDVGMYPGTVLLGRSVIEVRRNATYSQT
jgi:hypothetical protein